MSWAYFDFFSSQPAKDAAAARVAAQNAGYSQLSDLYGQAANALTSNTQQATGLYQPLVQSTGAGLERLCRCQRCQWAGRTGAGAGNVHGHARLSRRA